MMISSQFVGLIPALFRDQANMSGDGPKWILLDGDIDPMWIESLNTVMDDNKVLTLASNERIALTKMMRLIFEIASLRTATPATVSRAGILYINPQDLGWSPYVSNNVLSYQILITPKTSISFLAYYFLPFTLFLSCFLSHRFTNILLILCWRDMQKKLCILLLIFFTHL